MRLLDILASAFINTFGITQPTDKTRRRASWFIALMLLGTVVVVALFGVTFYRILHHTL